MTEATAVTYKKAIEAHIWEKEPNEHYVEEAWVPKRLFEEERFEGSID